jgi:hypothetical protein
MEEPDLFVRIHYTSKFVARPAEKSEMPCRNKARDKSSMTLGGTARFAVMEAVFILVTDRGNAFQQRAHPGTQGAFQVGKFRGTFGSFNLHGHRCPGPIPMQQRTLHYNHFRCAKNI